MSVVNLNLRGFVALRNSAPVVADIQGRAQRIADAAGDGFDVGQVRYNNSISGRAKVTVRTATYEARAAEAADGVLRSALDAGR